METEQILDQAKLLDGTDLQDGRYTIRASLGSGGFGITYKAWDIHLRRFVAIKEFFPVGIVYRDIYNGHDAQCLQDPQTFQHGKRRFHREAQTLAKLDFSHIVKVYDSFEENNTAYIVMEYIKGVTLAEYVEQNGPIPGARLLELFQPLMRDLDTIHKKGMVHRDISPDNIMLTEESDSLKLIDFGTAKDLTPSDGRSRSYSMSHTVVRINYSPIEMFSSAKKQPSADIYSLCATMYFCLTGAEPPSALDRAFDDTLKLPPLSGLGRNTEKVILKGMSLKPENRYSSAEELMQALDGRAKEQKPRKRLLITLGCAAVVIALVLTTVLLTDGGGSSENTLPLPQPVPDEPVQPEEPEGGEQPTTETPTEMPPTEEDPEQDEQEVQTDPVENFTVTQDEAGYHVMEGTEYQIYCPFPADFTIDQSAAGETLLMRANSTVNRNYIEIHGKTMAQATTAEEALRSAEEELGGHVNYQMYGNGWFACSVDQAGVGTYRKGKLRANGTIVVWFDYYAIDNDENHASYIDYMESEFTSKLQS